MTKLNIPFVNEGAQDNFTGVVKHQTELSRSINDILQYLYRKAQDPMLTESDLKRIEVVFGSVINNSPSSGRVAWSDIVVRHQGVRYNISDGNTSLKYIYWQIGTNYFQTTSSFTPAHNTYLMYTNDGGIASSVWDKGYWYTEPSTPQLIPYGGLTSNPSWRIVSMRDANHSASSIGIQSGMIITYLSLSSSIDAGGISYISQLMRLNSTTENIPANSTITLYILLPGTSNVTYRTIVQSSNPVSTTTFTNTDTGYVVANFTLPQALAVGRPIHLYIQSQIVADYTSVAFGAMMHSTATFWCNDGIVRANSQYCTGIAGNEADPLYWGLQYHNKSANLRISVPVFCVMQLKHSFLIMNNRTT